MIKKSKIIFLFILILLVVLLSLPIKTSEDVKIKVLDIISPLIKGVNHITQKIFSIKDLFNTFKENKELHKKVDELSIRLNGIEESAKENERLKQILDLKKTLPYDSIISRVIARDAGTWYKTLVIDKGKKEGICPDMPVLAANGAVVGRVINVEEDVSRILLVTDVNSSIGAIVQETRTVGLVEGNGDSNCILNLIPQKVDVPIGSLVVTSGLGQIFPKGLPIGNITDISTKNQGLYKTAKLQLYADINKIEEVVILKIKVPNFEFKN